MVKTVRSIISLELFENNLPLDELVVPVLIGEFGKGITRPTLRYVFHETCAATTSLIFSLPNLKEPITSDIRFRLCEPPPIFPDTPQREPLEMLKVLGTKEEPHIAIAEWELVPRRLSLDPYDNGMELLIKTSSETMVALELGMQPLQAFGRWNLY